MSIDSTWSPIINLQEVGVVLNELWTLYHYWEAQELIVTLKFLIGYDPRTGYASVVLAICFPKTLQANRG